MRISNDTLKNCEPLFECFLVQHEIAREFRYDLFGAIQPQQSLFSETLRVLSNYASDRCRAVYCLAVNGFVFDAEIVLRSFYETIAKCLFLATCPESRREQLLSEFWEILPEIYDAKGAERAEIAEKTARRHGAKDDETVFAKLRDPELFKVEPPKNRKFRNEVEQRWSFSKIMDTLNRGLEGHTRLSSADSLFHIYGIASHITHASPKAFDLLEDRSLRGIDLLCLEAGHIARMLSDMVSLTALILHQSQVALLGEAPMAAALRDSFERMSEISAPFHESFHRSQDDFYDR